MEPADVFINLLYRPSILGWPAGYWIYGTQVFEKKK